MHVILDVERSDGSIGFIMIYLIIIIIIIAIQINK